VIAVKDRMGEIAAGTGKGDGEKRRRWGEGG